MALDAKPSAGKVGPAQQPNQTENLSVLGLQPAHRLSLVPTNLSCLEGRGLKTRFGRLHKLVVDGGLEYAHKVSSKAELAKEPSKEQHHACMLRMVSLLQLQLVIVMSATLPLPCHLLAA